MMPELIGTLVSPISHAKTLTFQRVWPARQSQGAQPLRLHQFGSPPCRYPRASLPAVLLRPVPPFLLTCSLSKGFGQLRSLVMLDLGACTKLLALPAGISRLASFLSLPHELIGVLVPSGDPNGSEWIRMDPNGSEWISHRPLSEGVGQLKSLKTLILAHCTALKELPAGVPPRILPLSDALALFTLSDRGIHRFIADCSPLQRVRRAAIPGGPQHEFLPCTGQERGDLRHPQQDSHSDQADFGELRYAVAPRRFILIFCSCLTGHSPKGSVS